MKHSRGLAVLALATAATTAITAITAITTGAAASATTSTVAAEAGSAATASTQSTANSGQTSGRAAAPGKRVRYAWLKGCKKKDYEVPCGPWQVTLGNGKTIKLADARVHPRNRAGKVEKESSATFAISGNGRYVNYFRAKDNKLVVRDIATGRVQALPARAARAPKGLGMLDVDTTLSADGGHILIDYFDDKAKLPTLLIDLSTKSITELPGDEGVWSVSPSGDKVLTLRTTTENTAELASYDGVGDEVASRVAPQVVANKGPLALSDDGVTTSFVIIREKGRPLLRRYDLSTDEVGPAVALKLSRYDIPHRLYWDKGGKNTLWTTVTNKKGDLQRVVKRTVDPDSGALRTIDSFRVRSDLLTWWLPGE